MVKQALVALTMMATAAGTASAQTPISEQIENLKQQVIQLNRDLFILEEDLLYPPSTQIAVYVSVESDYFFNLDSIKLKIDGEVVTHYLYTEKQINAFAKGGVQRLYMGNVNQGEHQATAVFLGKGPNNREYKRAVSANFEKDDDAKVLQIKIVANSSKEQPEFVISEIE
jgi:hypothetical protein